MEKLDPDLQAMLDERARTMAQFKPQHRPMSMYVIYRADLEMPPGKLTAQGGHALLGAMSLAKLADPTIELQYRGTGEGTKVVMYARNLGQLIRAYRDCTAQGIPCYLAIDRGHVLPPHFDGRPIFTALGIGPVYSDEVAHITKRYTLTR